MATKEEIKSHIENTREHISNTIDQLSDTIHKKMDLREKIRENPYGALAIAVGAGFVLSTFSTSIGKTLFRTITRSVMLTLGAYASKQVVEYASGKIMHSEPSAMEKSIQAANL